MNLPGNPHTDDAMNFSTEASLINEWPSTERAILAQQATTHATLALAHEVRTANLIALWGLPDSISIPGLDYESVQNEIKTRLGHGSTE